MGEFFIPDRKDLEIKIKEQPDKGEFLLVKKEEGTGNVDKKEELLKRYIKELEELKKRDEKKYINLSQFERFYKFIREKDYEYSNEKVKEFIKKQQDRGIAENFYEFLEKEAKNSMDKEELKLKLEIIGKHLRYELGVKRMEEKLKENGGKENGEK